MVSIKPEKVLREMFDAAVAVAQPQQRIAEFLPDKPEGRTVVVGAGKASAAMANAFESCWPGPLEGLVVTRYGYNVPCSAIEIVEAAHPVPDTAGMTAATRIYDLVAGLTEDDLVICLISGGGSSLLCLPAQGVSFEEKQQLNQALLKSGATISEMNCVRKHLSAIKGGRLAAAAYPARVLTLLISDVPGDDPAEIASGPTVPDPTTASEALEVIHRYAIDVPESVLRHLQSADNESPKPGDERFARAETHIIAAPQQSLVKAAEVASLHGYTPLILSDSIEGEARDVALVHAAIAKQVLNHAQPVAPPCAILSGGETTVTVRGNGRGGRNAEFALALARALNGAQGVYAMACDTDGIDGSEDNAGAIVTPDTLAKALQLEMRATDYLDNNDAYTYFSRLQDLVMSGPTMTNVNDLRVLLIEG